MYDAHVCLCIMYVYVCESVYIHLVLCMVFLNCRKVVSDCDLLASVAMRPSSSCTAAHAAL
jgi:hypothetical protein